MPELPEAETLVRQLRKFLEGAVLSKAVIRRRDMVTSGYGRLQNLESQKAAAFLRRGKYIGLKFEQGDTLWFHLGMTGRLYLRDELKVTEPHVHAVLEWKKSDKKLLFQDVRRFGRIFVTDSNPQSIPSGLKTMGPEPLEIQPDDFLKRFHGRTGIIKSLLLNQSIVAGLGNIYADESLFRAGIHPKKRASRLSREKFFRLHGAVQEVLKEAIRQGGSTIRDYISLDGEAGGFQKFHKVYGKQGQPCETCGQKIQRMVIAGRSSFFCSQCQP